MVIMNRSHVWDAGFCLWENSLAGIANRFFFPFAKIGLFIVVLEAGVCVAMGARKCVLLPFVCPFVVINVVFFFFFGKEWMYIE